MLLWVTVDWGDLRRASWTPWPRKTCPAGVMVCGIHTACSNRRFTRASKWKFPITGVSASPDRHVNRLFPPSGFLLAIRGRSSGWMCATMLGSTAGWNPSPGPQERKRWACFSLWMGPVHASERLSDSGTGDRVQKVWHPKDRVLAVAYDTPIPGYKTRNTLNIRLWASCPAKEFDMDSFNKGTPSALLGLCWLRCGEHAWCWQATTSVRWL